MAEKTFSEDSGRVPEPESARSVKAIFDPLTMSLELPARREVASDLQLNDLVLDPVIFHELVHSWQLFAFTSGLFTAAIRPIQSILVPNFLRQHSSSLIKPIVREFARETHQGAESLDESGTVDTKRLSVPSVTFTDSEWVTETISFDNVDSPDRLAMFTVHKYFFDFERLNAILVDPCRYAKDENRFLLGEALAPSWFSYDGLESALLDLESMMRMEIRTQLGPLAWPGIPDLIKDIKRVNDRTFHASTRWRNAQLGLADIQEGHARFLELQLIASHDGTRNSFDFFLNNGYLGTRYSTAYRLFLQWSGYAAPSTLLDWRVHIFILVCEYALNPTAPYLDPFKLDELFEQFHPGARFKAACEALAKLPSLEPTGPTNPQFMKSAFEAIDDAARPMWAIPLGDALRTADAFAKQFFAVDVPFEQPFFNLLARHLSTVLLRVANTSDYLTPLTIALNGPKTVPFLLPPAIKIGTQTFFPEIAVGARRPSWAGYLIGLVYCDLVDQLLRYRGPFTYENAIVPPELRESITKAAKGVFKDYFGVPVEAVESIK